VNARPDSGPPVLTAAAASTAAPWAAVVQQVLDGMTGSHLALEPVRDGDQVTDYVVVAVSPGHVDFSGQGLHQMLGRRITQVYPAAADAPTWPMWRDVLADGHPRQVGPFPYVGDSGRAPTGVGITARARRVGPGLLSSWIRHDEEARLAERIAQTERLAHLGWAEADLVTGEITWSDELYRVYERDPALGPMTTAELDALTVPEDAPIRRRALDAVRAGHSADVTYRVRVGGRVKHLRGVIDAVRDAQGSLLKVYGIAQDITAQETSRAQIAETRRRLAEQQQSLDAEHRLAAQLQQIVLPMPAEPFDLPGLRVAVRYLPAEEADRVGGDWFHAAPGHDGHIVLAVGDVAGHGIHAATVMAQMRHLLAGLTVSATSDPAELMCHLNRLLDAEETCATAVVARYSPDTRQVAWAQAGHPAPLHTRAARTTPLPRPRGTVLGAIRTATYDTATLTLDPGDLLLFYTDGLVERPHGRHDDGLAPVIAALDRVSASGTPQPLADLLAQLPRANPHDDTCILAVRHHQPPPPPHRSSQTVPA
jgi:serine phosphatase RsbU (regulator of sigma subunit)